MSYALVVYSVPLDELRSVFNSHDNELLEAIESEDAGFLAETDEIFQDHRDDGPFTCLGAIAQIINGEKFRTSWDGLYVYAFEAICRALGGELDNRAFQPPIRWEWIETVDESLVKIGFPLRVSQLAVGGCPIDIPHNAGIPAVGWWSPQDMRAVHPTLDGVLLDGVDADIAEAVTNIRSWLDEARQSDQVCLVGIYS